MNVKGRNQNTLYLMNVNELLQSTFPNYLGGPMPQLDLFPVGNCHLIRVTRITREWLTLDIPSRTLRLVPPSQLGEASGLSYLHHVWERVGPKD
jgi:hypothetical protein